MNASEGRKLIDGFTKLVSDLVGEPIKVSIGRNMDEAKAGLKTVERELSPAEKDVLKKAWKRDVPSEPSADAFEDAAMERMYQAFKNRIIKESAIDPVLLQLLTVRPEIELEVERRVVSLDTSKPKGRIARLISQGWFDQEPRGSGQVRIELVRTGSDPGNASVGTALADLTREGFLERAGERYVKAPGVKISEKELAVTR
jgi:hypothetical protein